MILRVENTRIKHGVGTEARNYEPGQIVDLDKETIKQLGASVEPVKGIDGAFGT